MAKKKAKKKGKGKRRTGPYVPPVVTRVKFPSKRLGEMFGRIVGVLGNDRMEVFCEDGKHRMGRIPYIIFGAGKLNELYNIIPKFGKNVLFIIGGNSLKKSGKWDDITSILENKSINFSSTSISSEPSPSLVDEATAKFRDKCFDLVVGIGGGSVIDAGKAISAMLPKNNSIKNYLEGIGEKSHDGIKVPYIAIPTTSGTGSEATKNAVISEVGPDGFKKSLRHDNLIPDVAIIDPQLMISCP
ncbi:unnamed protein product, partial [marine sediment metagenome]